MPDKNKHSSFTKYIVAAVAAVLVIGVTVTAVMIRSHRKGNIVIQKTDSDVSEQRAQAFQTPDPKKKAENEALKTKSLKTKTSDKRKCREKAEPTEADSDS